jgi:hypothetical protein
MSIGHKQLSQKSWGGALQSSAQWALSHFPAAEGVDN